jgi:hypothetical protein
MTWNPCLTSAEKTQERGGKKGTSESQFTAPGFTCFGGTGNREVFKFLGCGIVNFVTVGGNVGQKRIHLRGELLQKISNKMKCVLISSKS